MYRMRDRSKSKQTQWGRCHFEMAFTILRFKNVLLTLIFLLITSLEKNLVKMQV